MARRFAISAVGLVGVIAVASTQAPTGQERGSAPTFHADTRLVQVNVIVRSKDGQSVRGLTAADFKLFDKGTAQSIDLFSVQSNQAATPKAPGAPEPPSVETGDFSNGIDSAAGGATVILIDRMNTALQDQQYARSELLRFVGQIRPDDRVAIYSLGFGSVRVLHDFTSDAASLVRVLSRLTARREVPIGPTSAPPSNPADTDALSYDAVSQLLAPLPPINATKTGIAVTGGTDALATGNAESRVDTAANALVAIASRLAGVRGRKSLIWVSAGFPLVSMESGGPQVVGSEALRRATEALNDANIAIYPVDARGLTGTSVTPAEVAPQPFSALAGPVNQQPHNIQPMGKSSGPSNIDSMQKLAADTGGRAFFNTNDIMSAVRHAIDDGEWTYVLGYYPSHGHWDGRFRDIKVTVDRPSVEVRHRKGYLAISMPTAAPEVRQGDLLKLVGSPLEATAVGLTAHITRSDAQGHASGDLTIALHVDPGAVTLQKTADGWAGSLDLLIVQTTAEGQAFKSFGGDIDFTMPEARRERFLADGLSVSRPVVVRTDAQWLKVLVRDVASGALGSLVIGADELRGCNPDAHAGAARCGPR
jgi:VWFA-related protein